MAEQVNYISMLMHQIHRLPLLTVLFYCYQISYLQVGGDSPMYGTQWSESIIS